MSLSRRSFLRAGSLLSAAISLSACSAVARQRAQNELPGSLNIPPGGESGSSAAPDPIFRFLNRGGYGPRPGDYDRAKGLGLAALLEEQLDPAALDDSTCDLLLHNLTYYSMDVSQLIEQEQRDAGHDLGFSTVGRALLSKRQLYEAIVEFWTDHFNIDVRKNQHLVFLKIIDDREVIRPHALGKFRDLLYASAQSPAMMVYLDNVANTSTAPNENYARELMELHTLGVHAGYTQQDVQELARALTGWTVHRRGLDKGQFLFDAAQHDGGEKHIFGLALPAGQGQQDVFQVLDMLAAHPATAAFIAHKLVRRFVADEPPASLVERVAWVYSATDGDIKAMLREIFLSDEFASAPPKLKRPFTYALSALRTTGADVGAGGVKALARWLNWMGQPLFQWPPPDGFPDVSTAWAANLLPRWNFALMLVTGRLDGISVPFDRLLEASAAPNVPGALNAFAGLTLGHALDAEAAEIFSAYVGDGALQQRDTQRHLREAVSLLLASPAFQWT